MQVPTKKSRHFLHSKQNGFQFLLDTNAFPYGFLADGWEDHGWLEETHTNRQEFSVALHEKETIPKQNGQSDALSFTTSKTRGITEVNV